MMSHITTELQTLNAFIDAELDVLAQSELQARLRHDAPLRAQVESLQQLRDVTREQASYHRAPESLREQLAHVSMPSRPVAVRTPTSRNAAVRWLRWRPMAVSFGLLTCMALALYWMQSRSASIERLQQEVVASHVRSTLGEHLLDVTSSDRHTIKPWLSSKLGFSPTVQELGIPGSTLLGGRVDYLDDQPVAALVYRQGGHIVNAFVWSAKAADSDVVISSERGFQIARWTRNSMNHWVISDVNRDEFITLVKRLQALDMQP
jgi:anti-sigma factor RsiW